MERPEARVALLAEVEADFMVSSSRMINELLDILQLEREKMRLKLFLKVFDPFILTGSQIFEHIIGQISSTKLPHMECVSYCSSGYIGVSDVWSSQVQRWTSASGLAVQ